MWEFTASTECPHCGHEMYVTAAFNPDEADPAGCNSAIMMEQCDECYKNYWFAAYVSFDVEVHQTWKKSPIKLKRDQK